MALRQYSDLSDGLNALAEQSVDCIFQVHKNLGPGYPERVYEAALCHELRKKSLGFLINFNVPLIKDGIKRQCIR